MTLHIFYDILYLEKNIFYWRGFMVTKIGRAKDNMTKEEFIFWLNQIKRKSFGEVIEEIISYYEVARDVEKRMIESVLLTDVVFSCRDEKED